MRRRQPGQDGRMGGQRHRHMRMRVHVPDTTVRQPVERGREGRAATVRTEAIGPQRIYRDEKDIRVLQLTRRQRSPLHTAARNCAPRDSDRHNAHADQALPCDRYRTTTIENSQKLDHASPSVVQRVRNRKSGCPPAL